MLGRLDGKMDMILAHQSTHGNRLDKHELRINELEGKTTILEQDGQTRKTYFSTLLSIGSLLVAALALVKEHLPSFH